MTEKRLFALLEVRQDSKSEFYRPIDTMPLGGIIKGEECMWLNPAHVIDEDEFRRRLIQVRLQWNLIDVGEAAEIITAPKKPKPEPKIANCRLSGCKHYGKVFLYNCRKGFCPHPSCFEYRLKPKPEDHQYWVCPDCHKRMPRTANQHPCGGTDL